MQVEIAESYPVTHRYLCMDQSVFPQVWFARKQGLLLLPGRLGRRHGGGAVVCGPGEAE
jgi:hypothetical protein